MIQVLSLLALWTSFQGGPDDPERASLRAQLVHGPVIERLSAAPCGPQESPPAVMRRVDGRRSVPLAFALSVVVPGAGQAYNRQWVKAGVAVAIEAVAVTAWVVRRRDGLAAEDDVEAFAHAGWDPGRYAEWLTDYADYLEVTYGHTVTAPPPGIPAGIDFSSPGSWSDADRLAVDRFFDQVHALERQVYHPETGASFSHVLPYFGEQQYYELIGKYFQFAPGWSDYPDWIDEGGAYTVAIDPEHTGPGGSKPNVSATFYRYAGEHADAQDLLRQASRISMLVLLNHLVAGIDAAVSSKLHNDRLDTSLGLAYDPHGAPRPVASVRLRF